MLFSSPSQNQTQFSNETLEIMDQQRLARIRQAEQDTLSKITYHANKLIDTKAQIMFEPIKKYFNIMLEQKFEYQHPVDGWTRLTERNLQVSLDRKKKYRGLSLLYGTKKSQRMIFLRVGVSDMNNYFYVVSHDSYRDETTFVDPSEAFDSFIRALEATKHVRGHESLAA